MAYASIHIEGGLFASDLLDRIAKGVDDVAGQRASDFGLDARRLTDEMMSAFSDVRKFWEAFKSRRLRSNESITTLTRTYWIIPLFELLGFPALEVQRSSADAVGQQYFISHRSSADESATPIHIMGTEQLLDRRDPQGRRSPHSLVQDFLNRSDVVWGLATNGLTLRLLRENKTMARTAYVDFDLQGMVEDNRYSEFVVLYRLLHATRFPKDGETECLLEKYYDQSLDEGNRVRERLREGVEQAIKILGTGLIAHPDSELLRRRVESGELDGPAYYRQLLRVVYRLLFLMVAEERKLLFPDSSSIESVGIYHRYYSVGQLRSRAERYFRGDKFTDLWPGLVQTFWMFRDDSAAQQLGLHALNGEMFGPRACPDLESATCENEELLTAIRHLSTFRDEGRVRRRVNYGSLDVEEFGSVYESLLDFHPQISLEPASFDLVSGSERKQTGSYYTPPSLVQELINSALVPAMEERLDAAKTKEDKEAALLGLRVCDPAAGSGHFLLAAARRIARELAKVRSGEEEPPPTDIRHAQRDVVRTCIYAVDKNPLAVDLCKVALWMEGHEPGLPLGFLDHHIKCGDSLTGVLDMDVLNEGIPDNAYTVIEGDDKAVATAYRNRNREERERKAGAEGQLAFGEPEVTAEASSSIADNFRALGDIAEKSAQDVSTKEELYSELRTKGGDWWKLKIACDLWTSAFFMKLHKEDTLHMESVPTTGTLRRYLKFGEVNPGLLQQVEKTSEAHSFFHWNLEFPDVFTQGGFDSILGNPPWDKVEMNETEYFKTRFPAISLLTGARRKKAIAELEENNPDIWNGFASEGQRVQHVAKFSQGSNRFNLTAKGRMNVFGLFAELTLNLLKGSGTGGVIVPTGIASDHTFKDFFSSIVKTRSLVSLFDFENRRKWFPQVDSRYKFCLLTLNGLDKKVDNPLFAFYLEEPAEILDSERTFSISEEDIALMNPNTQTCPIIRSTRDSNLLRSIYRQLPVISNHARPVSNVDITLLSDLFNMTTNSGLFSTEMLPGHSRLLEGKMLQAFDHRAASVITNESNLRRPGQPVQTNQEDHIKPEYETTPQYWVPTSEVNKTFNRMDNSSVSALLVYKKVSSPTNTRTLIATIVPKEGIADSLNVIVPNGEHYYPNLLFLVANLNSFVCDYVVRQKAGGVNLNLFLIEQIPIIPFDTYAEQCRWDGSESLSDWVLMRSLELSYSSWSLKPMAEDIDMGGPPYQWNVERRLMIRCEIDAAYFLLYGIEKDDIDYIMETFPSVRKDDERDFGEYRTKRLILEIYDEMTDAIETGRPYRTRLDPPPTDPSMAHNQMKHV